jgi:hypothetical protein
MEENTMVNLAMAKRKARALSDMPIKTYILASLRMEKCVVMQFSLTRRQVLRDMENGKKEKEQIGSVAQNLSMLKAHPSKNHHMSQLDRDTHENGLGEYMN